MSKNEERFRAFHDDEETHPASPVAAVGPCLVYAAWKMVAESTAACARAEQMLGNDAGVVAAARVDIAARGDAAAAVALADTALKASPSCEALQLARARAVTAQNDPTATTQAWQQAAAVFPNCFVCAAERARVLEATGGRAAAATAWEEALKVAPDHADTLRRFAASVSGVDDVRALAARTPDAARDGAP
jgi:tetratricopeptide (TPR) repeat protein